MPDAIRAARRRAARRAWTPMLCGIIARASSPMERIVWSCFQPLPIQDPETLSHRRRLWCQAAANGDEARFATQLHARGLDASECIRGVSDVAFDPDRPRPRWTDDLARLLAPSSRTELPVHLHDAIVERLGPGAERDFAVLAPLYTLPWHLLERSISRTRITISVGAQADILLQLRRRWLMMLGPLLRHVTTAGDLLLGQRGPVGTTIQSQYFDSQGATMGMWLDCLSAFPVAARQLAVVTRNWWAAADECLRRLSNDAVLLTRQRPLASVVLHEFAGDSGDTHDGGRAVSILTLDHEHRWVYKPRELAIAGHFHALLDLLNTRGLSPALPVRTLVLRSAYAWEPFVVRATCQTREEVSRYFQRLGMLARIAEFTDASDLTTDNILAAGDRPTLIDAETLVTLRLEPNDDSTVADRTAIRQLEQVPLRSCVITSKIDGVAGRSAADIGALSRPEQRISPFTSHATERGALAPPTFAGNSATPSLRGRPVDPRAYWNDVESGYLAAEQALAAAAHDGSLQDWSTSLENARVRIILRDTHVYERLLADSVRPHRLTDGVYRDLSLERVWRAAHRFPAVNAAEQDALRDGDTPAFYGRVDRTHLELGHGEVLADYFSTSGTGPMASRTHALCMLPEAQRTAERTSALSTTLFLLDPRHAVRPMASPTPRGARTDPVTTALSIANPLFARAVAGPTSDIAWLGVSYAPQHDRWRLGTLPPTLATGLAGLGVLAVALANCTGDRVWTEHAERISARLIDALTSRYWVLHPRAPFHWSWYGTWYALATMATLAHDAGLAIAARAALSSAPDAEDTLVAAQRLIAFASVSGGGIVDRERLASSWAAVQQGCLNVTSAHVLPWQYRWPLAGLPSDDELCGAADSVRQREALAAHHLALMQSESSAVPAWSRSLACADAILTNGGRSSADVAPLLHAMHVQQKRTKRPIPWSRLADRHHACIFDGRAGLAYAFLRVTDPVALPSLRLVQ
jgi:hypothetical protein